MDNNNPAEMSNEDLEKDMQQRSAENNTTGNQENVNKSTAAEGTLKTPEQHEATALTTNSYNPMEEQDLDDLVHKQAQEDPQDGSLPDPDVIPEWEDEDDENKISS